MARRRLALDELLTLQLALRRRVAEREALVAEPLPPPAELTGRYRSADMVCSVCGFVIGTLYEPVAQVEARSK